MTKLAGPSYISDSSRTEQHIKDEIEDMRSVLSEVGGGYTVSGAVTGDNATWTIENVEILSSALSSVPSSNVVLVRSENGTGTDGLSTIPSTGLPDGRILYLKAEVETITVAYGAASTSGAIVLAVGHISIASNFVLSAGRTLVVMLRNTGSTPYWQEISRSYGSDSDDEILFRGGLLENTVQIANTLSTVGAGNIVTGGNLLKVASSNLTDGQYLKVNSSGLIEGAAVSGGDSNTLDGLAAEDFVIRDPASSSAEQVIQTPISAKNTVDIDQATGSEDATLQYTLAGTARGVVKSDGSVGGGSMTMMNQDSGANATAGIRIDASSANASQPIRYQVTPGGGFQSLTPGAGNALNADLLDGSHLTDIIGALSSITGQPHGSTEWFQANADRGHIILGKSPNWIQVCWGGVQGSISWTSDSDSSITGTLSKRTFTRAFDEPPLILGTYTAKEVSGSDVFMIYPHATTTYYTTRPWHDNFANGGMGAFGYNSVGSMSRLVEPWIPPLLAIGIPS